MNKSFGLFFFLKKPKGFVSGEIPIYLRVTIDGESFDLSSKRKCLSSKWNSDAGRMHGKGDEVKLSILTLILCSKRCLKPNASLSNYCYKKDNMSVDLAGGIKA